MGKVYLVGAGPGDPELLTLKGRRVLSAADAVLYDHLANPALLHIARDSAERIYVGKKRADHALDQDDIIALLIDRARRGLNVVRLKGGDPFIFGRGGEEIEGLAAAGVDYEVVPGVTSPLGIAACTGVPLTHREHSSVVTFVTGHDVESIDWSRTGVTGTVVVFMGLLHLGDLVTRITRAGRSGDTPAMAVRWGTRTDQQTLTGRLADLPALAAGAHLLPPVTIIIGEVVALRERLTWFEKRPLFGQRIIVTRAAEQADDFCNALRDQGAEPVSLPVIELAELDDHSALDSCMSHVAEYDWVIFTSSNAVQYFFRRLRTTGKDARAIRGRVCAIGPATRDALDGFGIRADLVPEESVSEGVAKAFSGFDLKGARILLPRAAEAREVLPEALRRSGASVDVADTYRNIIPRDAAARIPRYLDAGRPAHWITFTSGSTVKNWLALAGRGSLEGTKIASIGPATSEVLRKHGIEVTVQAEPHTSEGLLAAILRYQI